MKSNLILRDMLRQARGLLETKSSLTENLSAEGELVSSDQIRTDRGESQAGSVTVLDESPLAPNHDPWRMRIFKTWKDWPERKLSQIRKFLHIVHLAPLTEYEKAIRAEDRERKALDKQLRYQARLCNTRLRNALTNRGFCHKDTKDKITQQVEFLLCEYSPLMFRYWIDSSRLPFGQSIINITSEDTCQNLAVSCRHPVRANVSKSSEGHMDASFIVEIAGTNDIPNMVIFRDVLQQIPATAPALAFMVGKIKNGQTVYRTLEELPHLLIGGQTLGGKSNMLNAIICCLLARTKPNQVAMLMVDMKGGGIELMHYEGAPHLLRNTVEGVPGGIAQNLDGAVAVLNYAAWESDRRQKMFMENKIKNLQQWNRKHRKAALPRLVIAIDELALLLPEDDIKVRRSVMSQIRKLASTARAAGVHLVAATQSANKYILNETIKVNLPGRIVFSTPDVPSSILLVNDGSAVNLFPAGRAIFKHGTDKFEVQTPFISNSDIATVLKNARAGKTSTLLPQQVVAPEDIVKWAVEKNDCSLRFPEVYRRFNQDIEQAVLLEMLKDMDLKKYTLDYVEYQVIPGNGSRARMVEHTAPPAA